MQDYRKGQELVKNRNFKQNEEFFQNVFEVGRRYKIMNPDRMRATYGKLLYMLMDTANEQVTELLEFGCISCAAPSCAAHHCCLPATCPRLPLFLACPCSLPTTLPLQGIACLIALCVHPATPLPYTPTSPVQLAHRSIRAAALRQALHTHTHTASHTVPDQPHPPHLVRKQHFASTGGCTT